MQVEEEEEKLSNSPLELKRKRYRQPNDESFCHRLHDSIVKSPQVWILQGKQTRDFGSKVFLSKKKKKFLKEFFILLDSFARRLPGAAGSFVDMLPFEGFCSFGHSCLED